MTFTPLDPLDADELFMLGLRAGASGDSGSAIGYLKLAVNKADAHAKAHWALATEYAALKMPDRAELHFAKAVELDPQQPVARFQYGLLLLTSGRIDEAQAVWSPLDELASNDPVRLFKQGLLHMVRDEFDTALSCLRSALTEPTLDAALAKDLQMTIGRIEAAVSEAQGKASTPSAPGASQPADSAESHLALSAYRSSGPT